MTIAQPNIKIFFFNLVYVFLYVVVQDIFRFFITPKFWILWAFIFEKSKYWVLRVKNKKITDLR